MYNKMQASVKEQTAFRFESSLIRQMKVRAKMRNQSVNAYVTDLIEKDLQTSLCLPKVEIPAELSEDVQHYSGIMRLPSTEELETDERLARIWER